MAQVQQVPLPVAPLNIPQVHGVQQVPAVSQPIQMMQGMPGGMMMMQNPQFSQQQILQQMQVQQMIMLQNQRSGMQMPVLQQQGYQYAVGYSSENNSVSVLSSGLVCLSFISHQHHNIKNVTFFILAENSCFTIAAKPTSNGEQSI